MIILTLCLKSGVAMVVLGLGTNVGERLAHLRRALALLKGHPKITVNHVSPVYESKAQLPAHTPSSWNLPYFNVAVTCKTDLSPYRLLDELQQIEQLMGSKKYGTWSPRNIDIDILMWGDIKVESAQLNIPHKHLYDRPFMLWPLLDLYSTWDYPHKLVEQWGSRFDGKAPFGTFQLPYRIEGSRMIGVINTTAHASLEDAVVQAKYLFNNGAEVLAITPEQKWQDLEVLLEQLNVFWKGKEYGPELCIDVSCPEVAARAVKAGVHWINDIAGFRDSQMIAEVRDTNVKLLCMQRLPIAQDPIDSIVEWGQADIKRLVKQGINKKQIILDPGIGIAKTYEQNLVLIKRCAELKRVGVPISFGIDSTAAQQYEVEIPIMATYLFNESIDYIRTHNVADSLRAIALQRRLDSISLQQQYNGELVDDMTLHYSSGE